MQQESITELAKTGKALKSDNYIVLEKEKFNLPFELSPIQKVFFALSPDGNDRYTQSFSLHCHMRIPADMLAASIEPLVKRHSMLRARFERYGPTAEWTQQVRPYEPGLASITKHQLNDVNDIHEVMSSAWSGLDIVNGPVFSASICNVNGLDGQILFLTAHHLVIDLVSWRIILEQLEDVLNCCPAQSAGTNGSLLHKSATNTSHGSAETLGDTINQTDRGNMDGDHCGGRTDFTVGDSPLTFQIWCQKQRDRITALEPAYDSQSQFRISAAELAYWGMSVVQNSFDDVETTQFSLDKEITSRLLGICNEAIKTEPIDIFIGAIFHAFTQTFSERKTPTFFNESHGREPFSDVLDPSETIGWFTTMFPVTMQVDWPDALDTIRRVKDVRKSFPDRGWRWFSSHALSSSRSAETLARSMEIIFNYFGIYHQIERQDGLFRPFKLGGEQPTEEGGPHVPRPSLLELALVVNNGALQVNLSYNRKMLHQDRLHRWMKSAMDSFIDLSERLCITSRKLTLSDVPLLVPTYDSLGYLVDVTLPSLDVSLGNFDDAYICAPMQHGLLISMAANPDYYNICWNFEVVSSIPYDKVDPRKLEAAWQLVVNRHSIMRSLLVENICGNGDYGLVVLKKTVARVNRVEPTGQQTCLDAVQDHPPMCYESSVIPHVLWISQSAASTSIFCQLEISHTVTDGISLDILMQELVLDYEGTAPEIESMPYRHFVRYIHESDRDAALEYWGKYLLDIRPCYLPLQVSPPTASRNLFSLEVPLGDTCELPTFCRRHGLTSTAVIHVVWLLVLHIYTGLDVPCFGYLSSGRDLPIDGIEEGVGPFISMLVCRAVIHGEDTLLTMLKCVQTDTHRSLRYQGCSLGNIQQAVGFPGQPLFNTAMSQEKHFEKNRMKQSAVSIKVHHVHDPTEYDLAVHVHESKTEVSVVLSYWNTKLKESQVTNIAHTFATIFASILENPNQKIKEVRKCSDRDLHQIEDWNREKFSTVDVLLHDMIFEQRRLKPQANALCAWDGHMTYAELEAVADRLAHHIVETVPSIKADIIIPLCFEKSVWQPVAMLAVLKAGAAFTALDPSHPYERLASIVDSIDAPLILSSPRNIKLAQALGGEIIEVGDTESVNWPLITRPLNITVTTSNAAYVVFTSGSTGKPKGAVIEHKAYASNISIQQKQLHIPSNARAFQFASYSFDSFLLESLTIMALGGCVCIPNDVERLDDTSAAMRRMDVTWANMYALLHCCFAELTMVYYIQDSVSGQSPRSKWVTKARSSCLRWRGSLTCSITQMG